MIHDYKEEEQIKDKNGNIQYFKQVTPFAGGKIIDNLVSIKEFGHCLIIYSKTTKQCLVVSHHSTIKLFKKV